jgi:hypothetical protein
MRERLRSHLTYANVISTLTLFLVLGGGTALAAYVVSSNSQIGPGTVSGHKPPTGKHANIIAGSINGMDIADRSGVETCRPGTKRYGPICVGSDGVARHYPQAEAYCGEQGLRLPSDTESFGLAWNYNVPGVSSSQFFWADDQLYQGSFNAVMTREDGLQGQQDQSLDAQTVCVTDPSA